MGERNKVVEATGLAWRIPVTSLGVLAAACVFVAFFALTAPPPA